MQNFFLIGAVSAVLASFLWLALSYSSKSIDRHKAKLLENGYIGTKWIYEARIWIFPLLVFWRRKSLKWGWSKVFFFLIWSTASGLIANFLIISLFPKIDGVAFPLACAIPYGILASWFCLVEQKFPSDQQRFSDYQDYSINRTINKCVDPYAVAGNELLTGQVDAAAWARALIAGNEKDGSLKAAYVETRVSELKAIADAEANERAILRAEIMKYAHRFNVNEHEAEKMMNFRIVKQGNKFLIQGASPRFNHLYDTLEDAIKNAEKSK